MKMIKTLSFDCSMCYGKGYLYYGTLTEIGPASGENKQDWWSQLWYKVEFEGWREGRAAHVFREKFGTWPKNLRNVSKPTGPAVEKFTRHRLMVYLKGGS